MTFKKAQTANNGFCASAPDGTNISICAAIISSSDGTLNSPPAQSPGRWRQVFRTPLTLN